MGIETSTALLILAGTTAAVGGYQAYQASKTPDVQPILAPPPLPETTEAKETGVEERRKALRRRGFQSTIKTSPMGLLGEATVAKKGLLGE